MAVECLVTGIFAGSGKEWSGGPSSDSARFYKLTSGAATHRIYEGEAADWL